LLEHGRLILAIDQGTTNTKALLIARSGEVVARASRRVSISYPSPGWVEQDADELWRSVIEVSAECLEKAGNGAVAAIGMSNQRESIVAWDRRTGAPTGPCIAWQCRRTADKCRELLKSEQASLIQELSGLGIDPLFSASKAAWLLRHAKDGISRARNGDLLIGTVDSWLLWNLTRGTVHATDVSNASRTQLMNLATAQWDSRLLDAFGIPAACLPEIRLSSGIFAETTSEAGVRAGIPIAALVGDSHAALFGHAAFQPGAVKATYGTGSSLMSLTERVLPSRHGLSSTIAWGREGSVKYALEGNITNSGATMDWMAKFLRYETSGSTAAIAGSVPDSGGVYIVPAFAGLGAPHWDPLARGVISGLTSASGPEQASRAALESIAYQINDVLVAMKKDMRRELPELLTDGGASANDVLMQFQADISDCVVLRSASPDLSARGAAWLAGLAVGEWKSLDELTPLRGRIDRFTPAMRSSRREILLSGWYDALARCRSGASVPASGALK
jgi:glycerol kinase